MGVSPHWWVPQKRRNTASFQILSLLIDSSPSLLTSAAVVVGGRSCSEALECLSFTGAKLNELDLVTPVRAKSWDMDGILSFSLEFAFQGWVDTPSRPVNHFPRTEHSLSDWCVLALLMTRKILLHIHKRQHLRQVLHHTKGLHLSFVLESQYRCLRSDGFSCETSLLPPSGHLQPCLLVDLKNPGATGGQGL